jgi:hypothetical protein
VLGRHIERPQRHQPFEHGGQGEQGEGNGEAFAQHEAIVVQASGVLWLSSGVHVWFSAGSSPIQLRFKPAAFNGGVDKRTAGHV